jgi:hypothetical protein
VTPAVSRVAETPQRSLSRFQGRSRLPAPRLLASPSKTLKMDLISLGRGRHCCCIHLPIQDISVAEPESRAEEQKLSCLLEPEPKLQNCGSGSFLFIKDLKKFYRKKSWLQKEFVVNYHSFKFLILFGYNMHQSL